MPKISYQEIVPADVSESGTILYEWEYNKELAVLLHTETNNGSSIRTSFKSALYGDCAIKKWKELCQSKK